MDMAKPLILVANPGSASRKYALFAGDELLASVHVETVGSRVVTTINNVEHETDLTDVSQAAKQLVGWLQAADVLQNQDDIAAIALRVVAPGSYFLHDHVVDDEFVSRLQTAQTHAPLHVSASLHELEALRTQFGETPIMAVSDSAFHRTKPDYAWNYGINLGDADRLDIKRFGYHGLSIASVVQNLKHDNAVPSKMVVCHLGGGASVTAVLDGQSLDTTMGYSPLEGVLMATRSGSIDYAATRALKTALNLDDNELEQYLNNQGGLLGLGGSADIRELLAREAHDDHAAHLALETYVFNLQKAIGQMIAALDGIDALVFTGTVGERSAAIRERVLNRLHFAGVNLDQPSNHACTAPNSPTLICKNPSTLIYVIPANEAVIMARHARGALSA